MGKLTENEWGAGFPDQACYGSAALKTETGWENEGQQGTKQYQRHLACKGLGQLLWYQCVCTVLSAVMKRECCCREQ